MVHGNVVVPEGFDRATIENINHKGSKSQNAYDCDESPDEFLKSYTGIDTRVEEEDGGFGADERK